LSEGNAAHFFDGAQSMIGLFGFVKPNDPPYRADLD